MDIKLDTKYNTHCIKIFINYLIFIILIFIGYVNSYAAELRYIDNKDLAVLISAKVTKEPNNSITISWAKNELATEYIIAKRLLNSNVWTYLDTLDNNTNSYIDNNVEQFVGYEYQVSAIQTGNIIQSIYNQAAGKYVDSTITVKFIGYGYIYSGIDLASKDNNGKVLLLIDETIVNDLSQEINTFQNDLYLEGWAVVRKEVPRTEEFNSEAVKNIKSIIMEEYNNSLQTLNTVILLGRIAVPYSGELNPDGHPDHLGAWPADVYYSIVSGLEWTDISVDNSSASRIENRNIPGDGKFDASNISSKATLQVGRIDFFKMPVFKKTEIELLRNYLNKNHSFRTGQIKAKWQGLIEGCFPANRYIEGFSSSNWRNFASFFGANNVKSADFFSSLQNDTYMWAHGDGGGSYNKASGIGFSIDFDTIPQINAIFTSLFGSYFGDWDSQDNFLRAALCSNPSILTCVWSGRPHWYTHHLSMGESIGFSTIISQNNYIIYKPNSYYLSGANPSTSTTGLKGVHIALMGDPTLTMYLGMVEPASELAVVSTTENNANIVRLNWFSSISSDIIGYNIYRSIKNTNTNDWTLFEKINSDIISECSFIDKNVPVGNVKYMVKATKLQESNTGTFYLNSYGIASEEILITGIKENPAIKFSLDCNPNPATNNTNIRLSLNQSTNVNIAIYDVNGRKIKILINTYLNSGTHFLGWALNSDSGNKIEAGVYFIHLTTNSLTEVKRILVIR